MEGDRDFNFRDEVNPKAFTPPVLPIETTGKMSRMEEQLAELKAENCQLQTRLFHIEHIVLPGKVAEIEQLLKQIGNEKLEKVLTQQQCNHARNQFQENMPTGKNVGKENPELTEKLEASREEIQKLKTQRNELLDEVQLLKKDLNHKVTQFDEEKQILEDKLKVLQDEKKKFLETFNAVTALHRQLIETTKENPESSDDNDGGDAVHTNNVSVHHETDGVNCENESTQRMATRSTKRPRLSPTQSSESPTTRFGLEFHSVDKSNVDVPSCICGTTFKNGNNLRYHIIRFGENNLRFACSQCPKRYALRGVLRAHEKRKHGMHRNERSNMDGQDQTTSESEISGSEDE